MYDYVGNDYEENPLMAELEVILEARGMSPNVIAVDDARGMGTQPEWPTLGRILTKLADYGYDGVVVDDCLVGAARSDQLDFAPLYRASRQVEVPAVFHIWPHIKRLAWTRAASDRAIITVRGLRKR